MTKLEPMEAKRLKTLEKTIQGGLHQFLEVGQCLMEIRESKLYRGMHSTFASYCKDRWGMSAVHAGRLIQAVEVGQDLLPVGYKPPTERHYRELAKAPPESRVDVWQECLQEYDAPTAKDVKEVVEHRWPKEKPARPPKPEKPVSTVFREGFSSEGATVEQALEGVAESFPNNFLGIVRWVMQRIDETGLLMVESVLRERSEDSGECVVCGKSMKAKATVAGMKPIDRGFESFWDVVWRKVGKEGAKKSYVRSVDRLRQQRDWDQQTAMDYLRDRAEVFSRSPQAHGDVTGLLHPQTWLNQGRYDDDEEAWQQGEVNGEEVTAEDLEMQREREAHIERLRERRAQRAG
jgi:hypothetical protein